MTLCSDHSLLDITTVEDCRKALDALNVGRGSILELFRDNFPKGCSIRIESQRPVFNHGDGTRRRSDLELICRAEPRCTLETFAEGSGCVGALKYTRANSALECMEKAKNRGMGFFTWKSSTNACEIPKHSDVEQCEESSETDPARNVYKIVNCDINSAKLETVHVGETCTEPMAIYRNVLTVEDCIPRAMDWNMEFFAYDPTSLTCSVPKDNGVDQCADAHVSKTGSTIFLFNNELARD